VAGQWDHECSTRTPFGLCSPSILLFRHVYTFLEAVQPQQLARSKQGDLKTYTYTSEIFLRSGKTSPAESISRHQTNPLLPTRHRSIHHIITAAIPKVFSTETANTTLAALCYLRQYREFFQGFSLVHWLTCELEGVLFLHKITGQRVPHAQPQPAGSHQTGNTSKDTWSGTGPGCSRRWWSHHPWRCLKNM